MKSSTQKKLYTLDELTIAAYGNQHGQGDQEGAIFIQPKNLGVGDAMLVVTNEAIASVALYIGPDSSIVLHNQDLSKPSLEITVRQVSNQNVS